MSHEEQIEWPSFETVLRDVAPDSPTARSLASADRRAQYSATAEAVRSTDLPRMEQAHGDIEVVETIAAVSDSATIDISEASLPEPLAPLDIDTSSIRALLEPRPSSEVESPTVEEALRELDPLPELELGGDFESFGDAAEIEDDAEIDAEPAFVTEIPEPLDSTAFDTTAFDSTAAFDTTAFDSTAFDTETETTELQTKEVVETAELETAELETAELEIAEPEPTALDTEELHAEEFDVAVPNVEEIDFADLAGPGDTLEFAAFEPLTFDVVEPAVDQADLLEPLDDDSLVFELAADEIEQVDAAHELDAVDSAEPLADPFSPEDFGATNEEADEDLIFADVHDTPADDIDYSSIVVDVDDLQVDDLSSPDVPELPESVTSVPGIELPGEETAPVEVFDDLAPMSMQGLEDTPAFEPASDTFDTPGLDLFDLNDDSDAIEQERIALHGEEIYEESGFDSIAAADEIETDLDQLIGIGDDEADPDNVIPLRPDIDVAQAQTTPEPSPMAPEGPLLTGGTGWVALAPVPTSQAPDPWADMRPTEEPKKTGFWANRPKFFGGDERRKRKSERREAEAEPIQQAVDVTFDKECPRCGSECQVDLDDPIGRRVHVSCPSCQNIWYTPYILEDSQAG